MLYSKSLIKEIVLKDMSKSSRSQQELGILMACCVMLCQRCPCPNKHQQLNNIQLEKASTAKGCIWLLKLDSNKHSCYFGPLLVTLFDFECVNLQQIQFRGDRGWTLKNLHFTPYLSNQKTFTLHLGSAVSPLCLL